MTLYLSNRDGNGKTSEEGHYRFQTNLWSGNIIESTALQVTQNSPLGMSVLVAAGNFKIDAATGYSYTGWNSATATVAISTADPANPRITTIVAYVDKTASTSASPPNNPGIIKLIAVNGTPAGSPTPPSSGTIQTAIGAGNPYITLANITIPAASTTVTNANISDTRVGVELAYSFVGTNALKNSAVTNAKLATNSVGTTNIIDANVTNAKLASGAVTTAKFKPSIINSAFVPAASRWNQTTTGTWQTITNCSMNYTAGPTPERLILTVSVMASKSAGSGETTLAVNGVQQTLLMYAESSWAWTRESQIYVVDVAANSTTNLAVQTLNESGGGSMYVCNEVAKWMPTITGFSIYNGA